MNNYYYKFLLVFALLLFQSCSLFTGTDDELTEVTLGGIIIPGKTFQDEDIVIKYIWQGGGCLRSIEEVKIKQYNSQIMLTPIGRLTTSGACPEDIFWKIETVSLGNLRNGFYTIRIFGKASSFNSSLVIPKSAPDSLFQFYVTTVGTVSGQLLAGIDVQVTFMPPTDSTLVGVTDSSGVVVLSYESLLDMDSLRYYPGYQPSGYYRGQTIAYIGQPEVITLGISGK